VAFMLLLPTVILSSPSCFPSLFALLGQLSSHPPAAHSTTSQRFHSLCTSSGSGWISQTFSPTHVFLWFVIHVFQTTVIIILPPLRGIY
jgi:hypothetical protein